MSTEFETKLDELTPVLDYFLLGLPLKVVSLEGHANKDYLVTTPNGKYLVKIFQEEQPVNTRLSEADYVQHLSGLNFPVPTYVQAPDGDRIFHAGGTMAMVQEGIAGSTPEVTAESLRQIGKTMGQLHKTPSGNLQPRHGWFSPEYIQDKINTLKTDFKGDPTAQKILSAYDSCTEFEAITLPNLPTSIIHTDIQSSNTIFRDNKLVAIVDWEDSTIGTSLLDFAIVVGYWCFQDGKINNELYKALYSSYTVERPFTEMEIKHLAACIRYVGVAETAERYVLWGKEEGYDALWALGLYSLSDSDLKV